MSKKQKVLIIDNDSIFANELKDCLAMGSYTVLPIIDNVDEALNSIKNNQPDGIVLDIQLKGKLGLDIINYLNPESDSDYNPALIVVSSLITSKVITFLNQKKCFYFEKNYNYTHQLVLNYFNDMMMAGLLDVEQNQKNENKTTLTEAQIKHWIHKRLDAMGFSAKVVAYQYLTDTIYYILDPTELNTSSLTRIFKAVAKHTTYGSTFTGIKRLITVTYQDNPELFCKFYDGTKENGITKSIPSVKDFIYHIIDEFKKEH